MRKFSFFVKGQNNSTSSTTFLVFQKFAFSEWIHLSEVRFLVANMGDSNGLFNFDIFNHD